MPQSLGSRETKCMLKWLIFASVSLYSISAWIFVTSNSSSLLCLTFLWSTTPLFRILVSTKCFVHLNENMTLLFFFFPDFIWLWVDVRRHDRVTVINGYFKVSPQMCISLFRSICSPLGSGLGFPSQPRTMLALPPENAYVIRRLFLRPGFDPNS